MRCCPWPDSFLIQVDMPTSWLLEYGFSAESRGETHIQVWRGNNRTNWRVLRRSNLLNDISGRGVRGTETSGASVARNGRSLGENRDGRTCWLTEMSRPLGSDRFLS
jgi:hypothetical protein